MYAHAALVNFRAPIDSARDAMTVWACTSDLDWRALVRAQWS